MNEELIKARVPKKMKDDVEKIARSRGETLAVIVRDAIRDYIEKHSGTEHLSESARRKKAA